MVTVCAGMPSHTFPRVLVNAFWFELIRYGWLCLPCYLASFPSSSRCRADGFAEWLGAHTSIHFGKPDYAQLTVITVQAAGVASRARREQARYYRKLMSATTLPALSIPTADAGMTLGGNCQEGQLDSGLAPA
jgi:hypothetical protein